MARAPHSPPPPFPQGWYALATSAELAPGQILSRRLAAEDVVVYRTRSGLPRVSQAHCPHLGAQLGCGGTVVGETIRCPFHGFRFGGDGRCVATGYGTRPPPKAVLRVWPVQERNGFVMAWFDPAGQAPSWMIPELDAGDWSRLHTTKLEVGTHVQEIAENSVDVGHFSVLHGYRQVEMRRAVATEGPVLRARYRFERPGGAFGGMPVRAELDVTLHGLGYSLVEVEVRDLGLRTRQFVLATPLDVGKADLRLGIALRREPSEGLVSALMGLLPAVLFDEIAPRRTLQQFARDVEQDVPIWNHKRYVDPPILAEGDGPLGKYRSWARQFYTQPT